jgi:hypothetical protein
MSFNISTQFTNFALGYLPDNFPALEGASAPLNMSGNAIFDLPPAAQPSQPITLGQLTDPSGVLLASWSTYPAVSNINCSGFQIKGLSTGSASTDAVNRNQLAAWAAFPASTNINCLNNKITSLADGTNNQDVVNVRQLNDWAGITASTTIKAQPSDIQCFNKMRTGQDIPDLTCTSSQNALNNVRNINGLSFNEIPNMPQSYLYNNLYRQIIQQSPAMTQDANGLLYSSTAGWASMPVWSTGVLTTSGTNPNPNITIFLRSQFTQNPDSNFLHLFSWNNGTRNSLSTPSFHILRNSQGNPNLVRIQLTLPSNSYDVQAEFTAPIDLNTPLNWFISKAAGQNLQVYAFNNAGVEFINYSFANSQNLDYSMLTNFWFGRSVYPDADSTRLQIQSFGLFHKALSIGEMLNVIVESLSAPNTQLRISNLRHLAPVLTTITGNYAIRETDFILRWNRQGLATTTPATLTFDESLLSGGAIGKQWYVLNDADTTILNGANSYAAFNLATSNGAVFSNGTYDLSGNLLSMVIPYKKMAIITRVATSTYYLGIMGAGFESRDTGLVQFAVGVNDPLPPALMCAGNPQAQPFFTLGNNGVWNLANYDNTCGIYLKKPFDNQGKICFNARLGSTVPNNLSGTIVYDRQGVEVMAIGRWTGNNRNLIYNEPAQGRLLVDVDQDTLPTGALTSGVLIRSSGANVQDAGLSITNNESQIGKTEGMVYCHRVPYYNSGTPNNVNDRRYLFQVSDCASTRTLSTLYQFVPQSETRPASNYRLLFNSPAVNQIDMPYLNLSASRITTNYANVYVNSSGTLQRSDRINEYGFLNFICQYDNNADVSLQQQIEFINFGYNKINPSGLSLSTTFNGSSGFTNLSGNSIRWNGESGRKFKLSFRVAMTQTNSTGDQTDVFVLMYKNDSTALFRSYQTVRKNYITYLEGSDIITLDNNDFINLYWANLNNQLNGRLYVFNIEARSVD